MPAAQLQSISELPEKPAVYALYGGVDRQYVAYVGVTKNLKGRIIQHLVARDSSIATRYSPVGLLNPELVAEVRWWEHPQFAERFFGSPPNVLPSTSLNQPSAAVGVCQVARSSAPQSRNFALIWRPCSPRIVLPSASLTYARNSSVAYRAY